MFDRHLINCCAPTLASLKSGSLFCCKQTADTCMEDAVDEWNSAFSDLGLCMYILRKSESSALIYVYRTTSLALTLKDPEVQSFLVSYGYESCRCCDGCEVPSCSIESCLEHLKNRIAISAGADPGDDMTFPHEIGIFLGYPLHDVIGFIKNKGMNSKYTGLWKVYGDKDASMKMFEKFRKCSDVYGDLWRSGRRSIMQLTVAG